MEQALADLEGLLVEERRATCRADVLRLHALQEEKRVLIDRIRELGASTTDMAHVESLARSNIRLMRQLSQMLRAIAFGREPAAYDRSGTLPPPARSSSRGAL